MSTSVNKLMVLGRLTKDPEMKTLGNGTKLCEFTVATNERYKDKDGNQKEEAEFHNFIAWNKQAEIINQHKKKGEMLFVIGKKKTSRWETPEGDKRSKIEFHVSEFEFVSTGASKSSDLPFEG